MVSSRRSVGLIALVLLLGLFAGCGDSTNRLLTIEITLATARTTHANLFPTRTQQATATGTYTDGTTADITADVVWASSNPAIASIDAIGLTTGVSAGTVLITATLGAVRGQIDLVVDPVLLTSITVTAPNQMVPDGMFLQLTATGTFNDGTTAVITNTAMWTSNMTSVATVDPMGAVEGISLGNATITASQAGITGSFAVTVTDGVLETITVEPVTAGQDIMPAGRVVPFRAIGRFSGGVDNDITQMAVWSSLDSSIATVSNTADKGLVRFERLGTTFVRAMLGTVAGVRPITVQDAVVDSITVTPATPTLPQGLTLQFACTAMLSDASVDDCSTDCVWTSSNTGLATINSAGLATANGTNNGTTNIDCDYLTFSDDADLIVTDEVLVSINVTPANRNIPIALPTQYTALGTFSNATTLDITPMVAWTTTGHANFTIGSQGLATAAPGTTAGACTVTATMGLVNNVANCNLTAGVIQNVDVDPDGVFLPVGLMQQFTATGAFSDSNSYDVTQAATWTLTVPALASVSNAAGSRGLVTASASMTGTTDIVATFAAVSGQTSLTVDPPPAPEIGFFFGASPFSSLGLLSLGVLDVGTPEPFTFTIRNEGSSNLTLGPSTFTTQNGCTCAFTTTPTSPIAPAGMTTIAGTLTPTQPGPVNCIFNTPSNDTTGGENPYIVQVRADGVEPDIQVEFAANILTDGEADELGLVTDGLLISRTFTVRNTGGSTLTISNAAVATSDHCSGVVTTQPGGSVAPSGTTTFTVSITPIGALGLPFACHFVINSNDPGTPAFSVIPYGIGTAPLGNFGPFDGVWNGDNGCGLGQFNLDTGPTILSSNFPGNPNTVFTLTSPTTATAGPNLFIFSAPNHSCIITLPGGATIRINCSNPGGGSCVEFFTPAPQPEIRVHDFNSNVEILSAVPVYLGDSFIGRTYSGLIFNDGAANLNIGTILAGTSTNCSITQISQVSPSTIAPGGSRGFGFDFSLPFPLSPWECVINIPSNDPNEPVFVVRVKAGGPPI